MPEPGRMHLPEGYGEFSPFTIESAPRWDEVEPKLERSRNYWVTVSDAAGPHAVPVWGVWSDLAFIFSTDPLSRKAKAIEASSSVQIHLESGDDVVIVHGRAERLSSDLLDDFIAAYADKYGVQIGHDDPNMVIYRVTPDLAMTWIEQDFARTAARWEF